MRQRLVSKPLPKITEPSKRSLTPSRATWLVLRRPEILKQQDKQLITQLMTQHSDLALAINLAQDFAQLVRQRQPSQLEEWLDMAINSKVSPLSRFAQSLREDYDAVKAGVTLPTSNGHFCWTA